MYFYMSGGNLYAFLCLQLCVLCVNYPYLHLLTKNIRKCTKKLQNIHIYVVKIQGGSTEGQHRATPKIIIFARLKIFPMVYRLFLPAVCCPHGYYKTPRGIVDSTTGRFSKLRKTAILVTRIPTPTPAQCGHGGSYPTGIRCISIYAHISTHICNCTLGMLLLYYCLHCVICICMYLHVFT